jgi:hypothetical protein
MTSKKILVLGAHGGKLLFLMMKVLVFLVRLRSDYNYFLYSHFYQCFSLIGEIKLIFMEIKVIWNKSYLKKLSLIGPGLDGTRGEK